MIPNLAILDDFCGEDDELMLGRNFGPQIAAKDFHPQNGMRRLEDAELETFGGSSSNIPAGCRHPKPTAASQGDSSHHGLVQKLWSPFQPHGFSSHVPHVCQKVAPKSSIYGQNPLNFAQIHLACDLLRQVWAGRQWQDLASRDIYPEVAAASPIIHPIITVSDIGPNLGWKRKMEQKLSMASNTSRTLRAGLIGHMANWSDFNPNGPTGQNGPTGPTARNPAKHPKNRRRVLHKYPIWVVPYWVLVRPSPSAFRSSGSGART